MDGADLQYSHTHHRPDGDSRNSPELKQESSNSSATTELPVSFSISTLRDNKIWTIKQPCVRYIYIYIYISHTYQASEKFQILNQMRSSLLACLLDSFVSGSSVSS